MRSNNTSGHKGVYWNRKAKRWFARIGHHGEVLFLGAFKEFEKACAVYTSARDALFTHHTQNIDKTLATV